MKDKGLSLILKAIDVSLELKKLIVAVAGLAATLAAVAVLILLGSRIGAVGGFLFGLIAIAAAWIGLSLVYGMVTRMAYLHLTTGDSGTWQGALEYARGRLASLMFTGLTLALAVLAVFLVEVILMLLGRIPYLGELLASLAFLPLTIINAFVILVVVVGSWLIYPVIAAEGTGVVSTIRRVVEIVRRSPGQVVAYVAIALILVAFASWILFAIGYGGIAMTTGATLAGAGQRMSALFGGLFSNMMSPYSMMSPYGYYGSRYSPTFTMTIAQLIYGIGLAGFFALLVSFPTVFMMSAATATYLNVQVSEDELAGEPAPTVDLFGTVCPHCGAAVEPGQRFCAACGGAV